MNSDERALVTEARANIRIVRADPNAVWPPNTLETAESLLTQALADAPATTALDGVAVTYGGHGFARDAYLGHTDEEVAWGPHDSWPLIAPSDGRVELYDFGTPLFGAAAMDPEYVQRHHDLFDGWVCIVPPDPSRPGFGQTMHVAVFWPSQAIQTSGGRLTALWFGHVRGNVRTGAVNKGDTFAETGASGIQFERAGVATARAAHAHVCASTTGQLSPNGDVDGMLACEAMGWQVRFIGNDGPGPDQYKTGAYCAGRLLADFQNGGKPLPRVAPD